MAPDVSYRTASTGPVRTLGGGVMMTGSAATVGETNLAFRVDTALACEAQTLCALAMDGRRRTVKFGLPDTTSGLEHMAWRQYSLLCTHLKVEENTISKGSYSY